MLEGGPIPRCAAGRVLFFDLSVLNWVYNFVRVCQQGIACTKGFICWINFVQYKGNDFNVDLL